MKLLTTIPARRDGTLNVTGVDGAIYEGVKNTFGDIEFDIPCELTVASLLAGGKFYPADEEDFDAAETLLSGSDEDDQDDEDSDDVADDADAAAPIESGTNEDAADNASAETALPVEANTPPSTAKPKNTSKKK